MINRSITIFTIDRPTVDGPGKSIRMMHWLAHLSSQYRQVVCIYFSKKSLLKEDWAYIEFKNVEWILIPIQVPGKPISWWRRICLGLIDPLQYNLSWYFDLSSENYTVLRNAIATSDEVVFFRLYLYPVVARLRKCIPTRCEIHLDLDDAERETHRQLLKLLWNQKQFIKYVQTRIAYHYVLTYEKRIPADIDTLYYSNPLDAEQLNKQFNRIKTVCFPNKIVYRPLFKKNVHAGQTLNILFCGALRYFPNEDAVTYLLQEIWPVIQTALPRANLVLAGSSPTDKLRARIGSCKNVVLIANPESMKPVFEQADIMIVPLRAGGGTRIKILEAFSYGLPVISTRIGIHGLGVSEDENVLIAHEPEEWAAACVLLSSDSNKCAALVQHAYDYYIQYHSYTLNNGAEF